MTLSSLIQFVGNRDIDMTDLSGQSLGRYHILEQLGEGGMAIVYKAYDTRLERDVAIKIIRKGAFPADHIERILKRFEREAKALARLSHPNILKIHDYGEHEGSPYLVMEYLPGGTLKQKMGRPIPWKEAIQLLLPIAEALDYAHSQNMIHRDVKPANILLTQRGQPMLTDFGIAKVLDLEETLELTGTSAALGTPEYMAPEQATAKSVDHRADIYSLGVVLYEMVTGRKPFIADTPMAVLIKHATEALPRPTKFAPNLSDEVEKILLKALAKQPENRYQDMGELVSAFKGASAGKVPAGKVDRDRKDREAAERTKRKQKENEASKKLAREADERIKQETEKTERPAPKKQEDKPTALKARSQIAYWLGGFALLILGIVLFSSLNNPLQPPEPIPTNTRLVDSFILTPSETPKPSATSTKIITITPAKDLASDIENLAYFEIDSNKQCKLVFANSEKDTLPCPDLSPSLTRTFSWSPNGQFAVVFNHGSYKEKLYGFVDWTFNNIWIYIQPVDQEQPFLLKSFSRDYTFGGINWSYDSSKILYSFFENGFEQVVSLDVKSKTKTIIAKTPSGLGSFNISPDYMKIAYVSSPGHRSSIFVKDIKNNAEENITSEVDFGENYITYVDWISNDFVIFATNNNEIYTISTLDKVVTKIAQGQFPTLSPDRTKLAFYSEKLRVYNFSSNSTIDFSNTDLKGPYFDLTWSPNSKYLGLAENNRISVLNLDEEMINIISGQFKNLKDLVWSYDGDKIAFIATQGDIAGLFVAKSDGSQVIKISNENNAFSPAWISTK